MVEVELFSVSEEARFNRVELNNGLRDGKVQKADWCVACGEKGELVAHHGRYGKDCGLKVAWVCPLCHVFCDARRRSRERFGKPFDWEQESTG